MKQLYYRTQHIFLVIFITFQSCFAGLSAKPQHDGVSVFQNDFTLIQLNKEHSHSEASGLLLFSELSETETELNEAFAHMLKHIKQHFLVISVLSGCSFNNASDEVVKSECFTFHPSLLHIPLFLFNALLRI
jgi:hypothetical protein